MTPLVKWNDSKQGNNKLQPLEPPFNMLIDCPISLTRDS